MQKSGMSLRMNATKIISKNRRINNTAEALAQDDCGAKLIKRESDGKNGRAAAQKTCPLQRDTP